MIASAATDNRLKASKAVAKSLCVIFGARASELFKHKSHCEGKKILCFIMRNVIGYSCKAVANHVGLDSHGTVVDHTRRVARQLDSNDMVRVAGDRLVPMSTIIKRCLYEANGYHVTLIERPDQ